MVLLIIACTLIGSVILIEVFGPLSATFISSTLHRDVQPSTVIVEPFRDYRNFNVNREDIVFGESIGEDTIKGDFRKQIASRSVSILRSRGMTDKEIKSELLRDFALTEEQIDEILTAQ